MFTKETTKNNVLEPSIDVIETFNKLFALSLLFLFRQKQLIFVSVV